MQNRGGTGQKVASLRDDDSVEELMVVRDHQSLLFFTTDGHAFSIKAYEVPQASRTASGTALPQVIRTAPFLPNKSLHSICSSESQVSDQRFQIR